MPIYEYKRPDGTTFDVMQSFADDALTHDPETGVPVTKVLHAPAIHFKGKGFHNTDYGTRRRNQELSKSAESGSDDHSGKQQDKREEKAKSETAAPAASSSESKPAAKSESAPAPKKKDSAA